MKTLKKISLSDVKVMDAQEMKMIVGGQYVDGNFCRMTSGSGGIIPINGTGAWNDDVVCEGECPTETVSGNATKLECRRSVTISGDKTSVLVSCVCS